MVKQQYTKGKIITSLFWKLMERTGTQLVQFVVQIILARLLLPSDYGAIAVVNVFIIIANIFVQTGFNTALIQKKDIEEVDYSSVFYMSLLIAIVLYLAVYFSAPFISTFYEYKNLVEVLRVLGVLLFIGALTSIQNAVISRKMQFKKLFFSSLIGIVLSGGVGIYLAYCGFGIWSLVVQQLLAQVLIAITLFIIVDFRPKLLFSLNRVKSLFSYGWKLLLAALIDNLYMNLYSLIIGKKYSLGQLGYFNRGKQFPSLLIMNINGSIQSVLFPALASYQDDRQTVKKVLRRSIATSAYLVFPAMVGLAVIAKPLVVILLTEKWLPAVPFVYFFCASYSLWPIHTANLQAINALGYSNIYLRLEIIKKCIGVAILVITMPMGLYAMATGMIVNGLISSFINARPNKKIIEYGYFEQIKDMLPALIMSFVMGAVIYCVYLLALSNLLTIIVQFFVGVGVYFTLSKWFKIEALDYLLDTIKAWKKRKK